jgi:hypothetical protein
MALADRMDLTSYGLFTLAEVSGLAMPAGYKRSISDRFGRLGAAT